MPLSTFDSSRFTEKVHRTLSRLQQIISNTRSPALPSEVAHSYVDKFGLAEFITNVSVASTLNVLEMLGADIGAVESLLPLVQQGRSLILRFRSTEKCTFIREAKRRVESDREWVTSWQGFVERVMASSKYVTIIHEWFWDFQYDYDYFIFDPLESDKKISLNGKPLFNPEISHRSTRCEVVTTSKDAPRPEVHIVDPIDVNLTWLLQQIAVDNNTASLYNDLQLRFSIDRSVGSKCRTPRRNAQIDSALAFFNLIHDWAYHVGEYFEGVFRLQEGVNSQCDMSLIRPDSITVPCTTLFEVPPKDAKTLLARQESLQPDIKRHQYKTSHNVTIVSSYYNALEREGRLHESPILPVGDVTRLLYDEVRSAQVYFSDVLEKSFPRRSDKGVKLISSSEVRLMVVCKHLMDISQHFSDSVDYIEEMLMKQLRSAIGKELRPMDFNEYMMYFNKRLFNEEYQYVQCAYAIRRPDHYPEGNFTIEGIPTDPSLSAQLPIPIPTCCKFTPSSLSHRMTFPINAATNIGFKGNRYVHGIVLNSFEGNTGMKYNISLRTRQFSSYIVLIGAIAAADVFEPKYGFIMQNKDEVDIPLMMETLPTPKEFKDAIASLSPVQQRFAKAYRSMQLDSSLFAICMIQIRPQMEKLLKLPSDSLIKEIELSEAILELFIKYQISSDMIAFQHGLGRSDDRVGFVQEQVDKMKLMVTQRKEDQLDEKKMVFSYKRKTSGSESESDGEVEEEEEQCVDRDCDDDDGGEVDEYVKPSRDLGSKNKVAKMKKKEQDKVKEKDGVKEERSAKKESKAVEKKRVVAKSKVNVMKEVSKKVDSDRKQKPLKTTTSKPSTTTRNVAKPSAKTSAKPSAKPPPPAPKLAGKIGKIVQKPLPAKRKEEAEEKVRRADDEAFAKKDKEMAMPAMASVAHYISPSPAASSSAPMESEREMETEKRMLRRRSANEEYQSYDDCASEIICPPPPPPPPEASESDDDEDVPPDSPSEEESEFEPEEIDFTGEYSDDSEEEADDSADRVVVDYTALPRTLDSSFEALDVDAQLRPTVITAGTSWTKRSAKSLLSPMATSQLEVEHQITEKNKCYDLLDLLSKSGALDIEYADLHVVVAATHCFDKSLINTVIQDNVNPIEKVQRSQLIFSKIIQEEPIEKLIKPTYMQSVKQYMPQLIEAPKTEPALALPSPSTSSNAKDSDLKKSVDSALQSESVKVK